MKRYLVALFLAAFTFGCGSSVTKTTTPEPVKAPWETLQDEERTHYETTLNCPLATEMVNDILGWDLLPPVEGDTNPKQAGNDNTRWLELHGMGPGGEIGLVQYRHTDKGDRVNELAVLVVGDMQFLMLDYHIARDLTTGAVPEAGDYNLITQNATGVYFCLWM